MDFTVVLLELEEGAAVRSGCMSKGTVNVHRVTGSLEPGVKGLWRQVQKVGEQIQWKVISLLGPLSLFIIYLFIQQTFEYLLNASCWLVQAVLR